MRPPTPGAGQEEARCPSQSHPAVVPDAQPVYPALVRQQADRAARMYLAGRANGQPDSLEAKRIIESVLSPSYDGRTLIELLQNGHDAHPRDAADGRLAFRLDVAEGDFGVLYAANGGTPLDGTTFGSLCRVAMSSKRPDESIGNKGVGFKSVLNLSDRPELYSMASTDSLEFDGFCFRFARPDDFDDIARRVAPNEPGLADELRANVSSLKTPVPLEVVPSAVAAFGGWAATVVRLPLRDASALERAREQLRDLAAGDVPLHLFLPRLARIGIAVADGDGEAAAELHRDITPLAASGDLRAETAELQDGARYALLRLAGAGPHELGRGIYCSVVSRAREAVPRGYSSRVVNPRPGSAPTSSRLFSACAAKVSGSTPRTR